MKTATTIEFREVVRKYAAKNGITIFDSYTNRSGSRRGRTVGFSMYATSVIAAKIEKKLNKKGLTAKVRMTEADGSGRTYIRGTCVITL